MAVSGVRISRVPDTVSEKQLKVYFSNPRHGGGHVTQILYPLTDNSAVILFDHPAFAARVLRDEHQLDDEDVVVTLLPKQIFSKVVVEVEKSVSMFMNLNYSVVDELEFIGELSVEFDYRTEMYCLQGSWYQVEWALHHLDLAMRANEAESQGHLVAMDGNDETSTVSRQLRVPEVNVTVEPAIEGQPEPQQEQGDQQQDQQQQQGQQLGSTEHARARTSQKSDEGHTARSTEEPLQKKNKTLSGEHRPLASTSRDGNEQVRGLESVTDDDLLELQKLLMDTVSERKPDYQAFGDAGSRELKRKSTTKVEIEKVKEVPHCKEEPDAEDDSADSNDWLTDDATVVTGSDNDDQYIGTHTGLGRGRGARLDFTGLGIGRRARLDFTGLSGSKLRRSPKMPAKTSGIDVAQTDFGEVPLSFQFTTETNVKVRVSMDDISKQKTDAIVNSTSPDLANLYGVSRAIALAAGLPLQRECMAYIQKNGHLNYTDVMHTCAGGRLDPHVSFVLHTASPLWQEKECDQATHLLVCTYLRCLQHTAKLWLQTVAMPLISAGAWGFPLDVCIQAFYDAILLHCCKPGHNSHLQEVHLVCFDQDTTTATIMITRSLFEMDTAQALNAALERYTTGRAQYDVGVDDITVPNDGSYTKVKDTTLPDGVAENVKQEQKDKTTTITTQVFERKNVVSKDDVIGDALGDANIEDSCHDADGQSVKAEVENVQDAIITSDSGGAGTGNTCIGTPADITATDVEAGVQRDIKEECSVDDTDSEEESNGDIDQSADTDEIRPIPTIEGSHSSDGGMCRTTVATKQAQMRVEPESFTGQIDQLDKTPEQGYRLIENKEELAVYLKTVDIKPQGGDRNEDTDPKDVIVLSDDDDTKDEAENKDVKPTLINNTGIDRNAAYSHVAEAVRDKGPLFIKREVCNSDANGQSVKPTLTNNTGIDRNTAYGPVAEAFRDEEPLYIKREDASHGANGHSVKPTLTNNTGIDRNTAYGPVAEAFRDEGSLYIKQEDASHGANGQSVKPTLTNNTGIDEKAAYSRAHMQEAFRDKEPLSFKLSHFLITPQDDDKLSLSDCEVNETENEAFSLCDFEDPWSVVPCQKSDKETNSSIPVQEVGNKDVVYDNEYSDSDNDSDLQ